MDRARILSGLNLVMGLFLGAVCAIDAARGYDLTVMFAVRLLGSSAGFGAAWVNYLEWKQEMLNERFKCR